MPGARGVFWFFAFFQEFFDAVGDHLRPRPAALVGEDIEALGHLPRDFPVDRDHVGVARTGSGRLDHAQVLSAELRRRTSCTQYRDNPLPLLEEARLSATPFPPRLTIGAFELFGVSGGIHQRGTLQAIAEAGTNGREARSIRGEIFCDV